MNFTTLPLPTPLVLDLELSETQFWALCQNHRDLQFERTATGGLVIMPPTGGITGDRNAEITFQLRAWTRAYPLGKSFDSSTGFVLPNGATRSPDAAWVELSRWAALSVAEKTKFIPLCPDFVVELMSPSDIIENTRQKLGEYRDNGARLGWLIHPQSQQVEIYRPGQAVEILDAPLTLSGESVLVGFNLDLVPIWSA